MNRGTDHHPFHYPGIYLLSAIVNDDIAMEVHHSGLHIHLYDYHVYRIGMGNLDVEILSAGQLGVRALVIGNLFQSRFDTLRK